MTPVLSAILDNFKEARVDVLTSRLGKRTLANFHERIGNFHILNRKHLLYAFHKRFVCRQLRAENYDAVFCFGAGSSIHSFFKDQACRLFIPGSTTDL